MPASALSGSHELAKGFEFGFQMLRNFGFSIHCSKSGNVSCDNGRDSPSYVHCFAHLEVHTLIDSQALFHGVALVPHKHVEGRQLCGPLGGKPVHALNHNAIDVVVENCPGVG